MIKLLCNKCGNEITDKYFTVNISSFEIEPRIHPVTVTYTAALSTPDDALTSLINKKIYCKYCKESVEHFLGIDTTREQE